jgi:hypothetical protein
MGLGWWKGGCPPSAPGTPVCSGPYNDVGVLYMTKRTRLFLFVAAGVLVAGLGTGLVASYMGQNLVIIGADGPEDLVYIPADSQLVGFANVREIMDSELRRKVMEFGGDRRDGTSNQNFLQEHTGIDIERDVDQVIVSVSNGDDPRQRPSLAIVRGRFDEDLIAQFVQEKGATLDTHRSIRVYSHPESNVSIAFVEPGLVAAGTTAAVREAIDAKATDNNIRDNADLMSVLRESDEGNAWAVARFETLTGGGRLPAELADQLPAISWFSVSGHVNGGVRGTLRAQTRDDMAADDLRQVIQGFVALARMQTRQRPEFAELLNSLQLGGVGNTVSLGFAVPSEVIESIGDFHAGRAVPEPAPAPAPATEPSQPGVPTL